MTKENIDILKDYHESNLIIVKEFLQDIITKSNYTAKEIIKLIEDELDRRKKITEEFVNNLKEKYIYKYICYNLKDGIGSYTIFKVSNIRKVHKEYCELCYSVSILNIDGEYKINNYKDGSIKLYSDLDEKNINILTEEDYRKEFEKAIKYYKNLIE